MAETSSPTERLLKITLALGQYPILSNRIRMRMRNELFNRGILNPQEFEKDVREKAISSQEREGLKDPTNEEPAELWELRVNRVRDMLTDLAFGEHLSFELFESCVRFVLSERGLVIRDLMMSINPEIAPQELVLEQALSIERLPLDQRSNMAARLLESKVVLIRTLISDQLGYINVAKEWFTTGDLAEIRRRKIGAGRIGGKAAGMLLAARILKEAAEEPLQGCLQTPESYFIGSDEFYSFISLNKLVHWNDQKYKSEDEMRSEYPAILHDFENGSFSVEIIEQLRNLLSMLGQKPLIVRSSSLLEDNFGTSFAGKYDSIFLPNQRGLEENLQALTQAVTKIYASTLNPNALLYRRLRGLQDYDERMAILIQVVEGEKFGRYFLPHAAGVAFSRNFYRWAPQISREDGFVRLVWGLGTRAVDRVGNDYPRLVALSHPMLRPSNEPLAVRRYSQQYVDLIDLEDNQFKTLPVHDVLDSRYPPLRYLAQLEEDGYFLSLRSNLINGDPRDLVITFDELLSYTDFAPRMREMLRILERSYQSPVDIEFTLALDKLDERKPSLCITILQCRPQSHISETSQAPLPTNLTAEDILFSTRFVVPQGIVENIDYIIYVTPEGFFSLDTTEKRYALARAVGRLNSVLARERFIIIGPGRWGSSNADLGVPVNYGDIYNCSALVELAGQGIGPAPEPSLGTHFFQDLLESQIYPLAVVLNEPNSEFNRKFLYDTPNHLSEVIAGEERFTSCLRLIQVADYRPNHKLRIVMNDEKGIAIAYLQRSSPNTT
jgi:hypothetical protein